MLPVKTVLALSILASSTFAHFTLDYPPTRGFDEDKESQFCGGFSDVSSTRTPFPLSGGSIFIDSHHSSASVQALASVKENPTTWTDFNTTDSGTQVPSLTDFFQLARSGEFCWTVDFNDLNAGVTNGTEVTLMVQYEGGDGALYQCADLIIVSDLTQSSQLQCPTNATTNPSGTVSFAGASATASATVSGSAAASQTSAPAASASAGQTGGATSPKRSSLLTVGMLAGLVGAVLF